MERERVFHRVPPGAAARPAMADLPSRNRLGPMVARLGTPRAQHRAPGGGVVKGIMVHSAQAVRVEAVRLREPAFQVGVLSPVAVRAKRPQIPVTSILRHSSLAQETLVRPASEMQAMLAGPHMGTEGPVKPAALFPAPVGLMLGLLRLSRAPQRPGSASAPAAAVRAEQASAPDKASREPDRHSRVGTQSDRWGLFSVQRAEARVDTRRVPGQVPAVPALHRPASHHPACPHPAFPHPAFPHRPFHRWAKARARAAEVGPAEQDRAPRA